MKTWPYVCVSALESVSKGLMVPVMVLAIMDKGLALGDVALCMGLYSLTVLVLELPSGICSDLIGRKMTFCVALMLTAVSYGLMLLSSGMTLLLPAFVVNGMGRAFSSGSLEALWVDRDIKARGAQALSRVNTIQSVTSAVGLSAGSLFGGVLPMWTSQVTQTLGRYDLNYLLGVGLALVAFVAALVAIPGEKKPETTDTDALPARRTLAGHMRGLTALFVSSPVLQATLLCLLSTGFFLCSIEVYWQPRFQSLLTDDRLFFLVGVLACLYFVGAVLGNLAARLILAKRPDRRERVLYLTTRVCMALSFVGLALVQNPYAFMALHMLVYFFLGMANIAEAGLVHKEVGPGQRASALSLNSLVVQVGVLLSSLAGKLFIDTWGIALFWGFAALALMVASAVGMMRFKTRPTPKTALESLSAQG